MSTQTTQGTGPGMAASSRGPDGGNRLGGVYVPLTAPRVVAAGHLYTVDSEGSGNWQQRITFDVALPGDPHSYVVMVTQDDFDNNDGRNNYPPHVEKLDGMGNNEDDGYEGDFGGFILHTGDNDERRFMWTVIKIGDSPAYTNVEGL